MNQTNQSTRETGKLQKTSLSVSFVSNLTDQTDERKTHPGTKLTDKIDNLRTKLIKGHIHGYLCNFYTFKNYSDNA